MTLLLHWAKAPMRWMRKLYDWTIHWSKSQHAFWALFGIAFAESSFFPVPPDVLLIPMVVGNPKKWWKIAGICTLGSVIGAFFGYFIGWLFYESIGKPIVDFYHFQSQMDYIGTRYAQNAFLTILTAAFTPIPYKVITIAAGLFKISLATLMIASVIGRAGRFFLVAGLLRVFGKKVEKFIEKYFDMLALLFMVLLIGGFLVIKYMK